MAEVKNVLIFGGNGLVGRSFKKKLDQLGTFKTHITSRSPKEGVIYCDILDDDSIKNCFNKTLPDIVINCTNLKGGVDFCEKYPEVSKEFHFETNKKLSSLAQQNKATFVLISTDYVFDGRKVSYKENDIKNPLNTYGKHKLQAEQWIEKNNKNYIIARTTNVCGWDPHTNTPNFLMQLYFNLNKGKSCNVPSFLVGNPTYVNDLTSAICDLLRLKKTGIYHIVGTTNINRYSWAMKFCSIFNFDRNLINEIKEVPENITPRPLISDLNTDKLKKTIGYELSSLDETLIRFKDSMEK